MQYTRNMEPTREDLAYIAGFVDGKGYIGIRKSTRKMPRTPQHNLVVSVANTKRPVLDWMQSLFGGAVAAQDQKPEWAVVYRWEVSGHQQVSSFLWTIRPWLRLKADQCWLGLEFLAQRTDRPAYRGLPPEEAALRDGFYYAMQNLNARGRN